ncbi:MAG: DUF2059 domain-containing protein [Pyrinomonadaceae bacterium]
MSAKYVMRMVILVGIILAQFTWSTAQQQSGTSGSSTVSPEKRALISELLEVTEAGKNTVASFNSLLDQNEKQVPDVVWQSLTGIKEVQELSANQQESLRKKLVDDSNRMNKRMRDLLVERIDLARLMEKLSYDLYDRYFTEAELKDLIAFYRSSTGRKTIQVGPNMFTELFASAMETISPKLIEITTILANEEADRVRKELQMKKSIRPAKHNPPRRNRKM